MTPPGEKKNLGTVTTLTKSNPKQHTKKKKNIGLSHGYVVLPYSLCNKWCP